MSKAGWVCCTIVLLVFIISLGMFAQVPIQSSLNIGQIDIGGSVNVTIKNVEIKGEARTVDFIAVVVGAAMGSR